MVVAFTMGSALPFWGIFFEIHSKTYVFASILDVIESQN